MIRQQKVMYAHFDPPKINTAHAAYANAIAFARWRC